ncbi:alpha-amylase/subtilisin inhibitor-like [Triticum dicoccoides]|uniref:alpha-amylase/subtilisin inhibitor-like n=1 Tax=Triticum dicoccoides TaxID=85692 RepID=UPI001890CBD9|nr:alpha-amylase/subtilisin inhibitor-like [Triticum dicoccoides]
MDRFGHVPILPLLGLAMASQLATLCNAAQAQAQPVYDMDGHELMIDSLYHIMLPASGNMSGRCLSAGTWWAYDSPLHAAAGQCGQSGYLGEPVMVQAADVGAGYTPRLSNDVIFAFNNTVNQCMMYLQWRIEDEFVTHQQHMTVGHFIGAPVTAMPECTHGTICREQSYRFRVERHGTGYKLVSCHRLPCRDLVLYGYHGEQWLTVQKENDGREPFTVVFKKCPLPCVDPRMPPVFRPN